NPAMARDIDAIASEISVEPSPIAAQPGDHDRSKPSPSTQEDLDSPSRFDPTAESSVGPSGMESENTALADGSARSVQASSPPALPMFDTLGTRPTYDKFSHEPGWLTEYLRRQRIPLMILAACVPVLLCVYVVPWSTLGETSDGSFHAFYS